MPSNYFLDYLCEIGFAIKKRITVASSKPSYPNQNVRVPEKKQFYSDISQYSIEIGIAKCEKDNTRVIIPLYKSYSQQEAEASSSIIEKLIAFLNSSNNQKGGIPFTSEFGGNGHGYHAQHPENPVNVDHLLAAMGMFGPGPGKSGLDAAWATKYLSDLLEELKQNEAEEKAKERMSKFSKDSEWVEKFAKNKEESDVKEKEKIEENSNNKERRTQKYDEWWKNGNWELIDSLAVEYFVCDKDQKFYDEQWLHYNKGDTATDIYFNVYRHIYNSYNIKTQKMEPDTTYKNRFKENIRRLSKK